MKDKMCGPRNLLLLLSCFSRVQLCATPQTAAHQAPQSLGFSRQEYWSGLPFPSPMHESEKWKWSPSVVSRVQLFATPWTVAYQAPLSMGVARQEYWSGVPLPSPPRNLVKANFFFFFLLKWGKWLWWKGRRYPRSSDATEYLNSKATLGDNSQRIKCWQLIQT